MREHGVDTGGGRSRPHPVSPGLRVAWWCKSRDLWNPGVRMRAVLLMRMLLKRGIAAGWYDETSDVRPDCVVVRGRYDDDTVMQLRRFKDKGGRLVVDLCDNHFMPVSQHHKHLHQVENLRTLAHLADAVVTSAIPLARIVERECPAARRVVVIGDVPDDLSIVPAPAWRRVWSAWKLHRERAHADRMAPPGVARLVWFGSSGGRRQISGMIDLARIAPMLAELGREHALHLTVISDSDERFREHVRPLLPASRYVEWDPWTFDGLLHAQHIALIPAQSNDYTACKSDNRVVTSLRAGLAVVADPVPSYAAHADLIALGNVEEGLRGYLIDPVLRDSNASRGRSTVTQAGYADRVLDQWLEVCEP